MPLVALLPLAVILTTYFSGVRLPWHIPGGAWAVGLGTLAAWLTTLIPGVRTAIVVADVAPAFHSIGFYPPVPVISDLIAGLTSPATLKYLVPVILPMSLFNILCSLQ